MSKPKLKIPVAKIGTFYKEDPNSPTGYKKVSFTQDDFDYMLTNPRSRGYETPLRRGHNVKGQGIQDGETADAHLESFVQEGDVLYGEFEANNDQVVEEIQKGEFRYASGEFIRNALDKKDPTKRIPIFVKAVGLTNTPFIPDLPRATLINCSEGDDAFFRLSLVEAENLSDVTVEPQEENLVPLNKKIETKPEVENLADKSLDDIRNEIEKAFSRSFCTIPNHEYCYCGPYVKGIYDEAGYLIASKDGEYYRYDYTKGDAGYTFSEPKKALMQFEVIENLSDDLIPGLHDPAKRMSRMEERIEGKFASLFEKISNFFTGKDLVPAPVQVSLSEGEAEPQETPAQAAEGTEDPAAEAESQPEEVPAAGEGEPTGDTPAPQPEADPQTEPEATEPTEEDPTMEINPEIQAKLDRLAELEAQVEALEAERQSLADKAFEQNLSDFVEKASKLVTPAAADKLATIIRANRGVEAFSLSEGQDPISLDQAILEALSDASPVASETAEILGEQAGEVNLSDSSATENPWAERIAALKAQK